MTTGAKAEVFVGASYLREQAQRCVRIARQCPHLSTSHELEAMSVELMEKAAELDELWADRQTEHNQNLTPRRRRES